MSDVLKPGWSKPSTILLASEIPADDKAFSFALAQALEFGAKLIVFHAYDTLMIYPSESFGIRYYDDAAAARIALEHLEPLAERVREAGVECETLVLPGAPTEQILALLEEWEGEQEIDRIVMGTHSPGRLASCWLARWPRPCCAQPECQCASLGREWCMAGIATLMRARYCAAQACMAPIRWW